MKYKYVRTPEMTARDKARRDACAAAGLCRCGQARDMQWKLCARCREAVRLKSERRRALEPNVKTAVRWLERGLGDVIEQQNPQVELKLRYAYQALIGPDSFNDRCIKAIESATTNTEARAALTALQIDETHDQSALKALEQSNRKTIALIETCQRLDEAEK